MDSFTFTDAFKLTWTIDNFCCSNNLKSPEFCYRGRSFHLVLKFKAGKYLDEDTYNIYMEGVSEATGRWEAFEMSSYVLNAYSKFFVFDKLIDDRCVKMEEPIWSANRREFLYMYDDVITYVVGNKAIVFECCLKNDTQPQTTKSEEKPNDASILPKFSQKSPNRVNENETGSKLEVQDSTKSAEKDLDYRKYHPNGAEPDFILECGGCSFHVHKDVLLSKSETFAEAVLKENADRYEISDIDATVLPAFLEYIYTGNVSNMTEDIVPSLHGLGHKYGVKLLQSRCAEFWQSNDMSARYACRLLLSAYDCKDESLVYSIRNHILRDKTMINILDIICVSKEHDMLMREVWKEYVMDCFNLFKF